MSDNRDMRYYLSLLNKASPTLLFDNEKEDLSESIFSLQPDEKDYIEEFMDEVNNQLADSGYSAAFIRDDINKQLIVDYIKSKDKEAIVDESMDSLESHIVSMDIEDYDDPDIKQRAKDFVEFYVSNRLNN